MARVGPLGMVVQRSVREIIPEAGAWAARCVAQRALQYLENKGLLDADA